MVFKVLAMDVGKYINQSSFFRGLSEEHRCELAAICSLKGMRKREYLFHEGEKGSCMFLLVGGNMQLHKNTEDGREVVIRVIKPGEVFAEVVLFEKERYPVSARAVTEARVLVFPRQEIHRLLAEESFRNDFIALLMAKQRYLAERIQEPPFAIEIKGDFRNKTEIDISQSEGGMRRNES